MASVEDIVVSIDVGGSSYKAALVDSVGSIIPGSFIQMPSYSDQDRDTVVMAFMQMLLTMRQSSLNLPSLSGTTTRIDRIALDCPGPFDYATGTSLMKHKFKSIQGLSLFPIIRKVFTEPNLPIVFHHDLHACTYGAYLYDEARGYSRVFCIAIGTGLGTGCLQDGSVVMRPGRQPMYPIFQKEYKDGILEEYVANRGIVNEYRKRTGFTGPLDALQVELLAKQHNDLDALATYHEMGTVLAQVVKPLLEQLQTECLVFGGQISKGFDLFGPPLKDELSTLPSLRYIGSIKDLTSVTIRGAAALPVY